MARLFGALANAGAQMRERQFQREQYDAQQEAARRAEQRRVFEFAATQERLKEQAQLQAQLRQNQLAWQKQQRKIAMINQGYQPWEGAGVDPMVGDQPYETDVRGIKVAAERVPNQQVTIDGERYFRNTQRERNAAAQKLATDLFAKFATLDDAQQARMDQIRAQNENRAMIAAMAQAGRQQAASAKPASDKLTGEFSQLKDIADQADYAISLLSKAKGAAGPVAAGGRLLRKLTLQNPTAGDVSAAEYQRVTAELRKKLFGAAQSVRELRSASEFLPMLESSNDAFVLNALRGIGRSARKAAENRLAAAQAGGQPTGDLATYVSGLPSFDEPAPPTTRQAPDATARPKGAPLPNRVPVPWETRK